MSAAEKLEYQDVDLISVDSAPAKISVNYEEVRTELERRLEKYDVVVTADTLPDAKKLRAELNKMAKEFDKRRRDAVEAVSGPIRVFEDQMKSLASLSKDGGAKLDVQIKKFEAETLAEIEKQLMDARGAEWEKLGIQGEFRQASIDDLVKLGAATKAGNLSGSTVNELKSRVQADKQLQQQTEMRLLHLENQSYKAGLSAPLTRAHVETFLFADDDEYEQRLASVMDAELKREEVAQEQMRKKLEADHQRQLREAEAQASRDQEAREAGERMQQAEAARAELQQHKPEPAPELEPEPVPEAAQMYAYGPLLDPRSATKTTDTRENVETIAAKNSNEPVGIWVPGQLIAIVYGGEVFRKQ
ncbi:DUF1351 domain-containing protein [Marinobacterium litorale]|uniref:DUF1351 domain-containing protein n=1 Tax=Marinobacterium litorale TaxID=404770 RepID=UPI0003F8C040|nr:DUF1351 domain-containing protein [Marinobacterium litorale]